MSDNPFLKNADGQRLYVVTEHAFAGSRVSSWLVPATSLREAKGDHGWTRELYTWREVRAARQADAALTERAAT